MKAANSCSTSQEYAGAIGGRAAGGERRALLVERTYVQSSFLLSGLNRLVALFATGHTAGQLGYSLRHVPQRLPGVRGPGSTEQTRASTVICNQNRSSRDT